MEETKTMVRSARSMPAEEVRKGAGEETRPGCEEEEGVVSQTLTHHHWLRPMHDREAKMKNRQEETEEIEREEGVTAQLRAAIMAGAVEPKSGCRTEDGGTGDGHWGHAVAVSR
jgi:hypothetical protein